MKIINWVNRIYLLRLCVRDDIDDSISRRDNSINSIKQFPAMLKNNEKFLTVESSKQIKIKKKEEMQVKFHNQKS